MQGNREVSRLCPQRSTLSAAEADGAASPRKRLVNARTKRFRGNVAHYYVAHYYYAA
jgi:hypothetical protein